MNEGLKPQRSPRELVENFLRLGEFVKEPAPTPLLELTLEEPLRDKIAEFAEAFGIEYSDTLQLGAARSVPQELSASVRGRAEELLEPTALTSEGKAHLLEDIEYSLEQPMVGFNLVLQQCGIDLEHDKLGIFDPEEAPKIEREIIRVNYPNPYPDEELAAEHNEKMDRWIAAYRAKHNRDPLED